MPEPGRQLLGPGGEPISLDDLPDDDAVVAIAAEQSVLPTQVVGFEIECAMRPYPPDAPHSHRRAMYAIFTPREEPALGLCRAKAADAVMGYVELTEAQRQEILQAPHGFMAEKAAADAIRIAWRTIRAYLGEETHG